MKNEKTSNVVAAVASKWFNRLRVSPWQKRFNISRKELRALLGSALTQTADK